MRKTYSVMLFASVVFSFSTHAAVVFGRGASWRWQRGTNEASAPVTAWRQVSFNDAQFTTAPAPFWFGDVLPGGTQISGMQNVYSCIFLRKTFVITNLSEIGGMRMGSIVDDGFVAWINGTEVLRVSMPGTTGSAVTFTTLANNAAEPVSFVTNNLPSPPSYLVLGTNVLAVQVFQSALNSSDFGFDASLETIVSETNPPTVLSVSPAPGTVSNLNQITVTFSEPVSGVAAAHLLVNGIGATTLTPVNGSTYTFGFVQPAYGNVAITWSAGHNIYDQALPPNRFNATGPGATWSYNLVDNTAPIVAALSPGSSATVRALTNITVLFSEPVSGVQASDLLINNTPASGVSSAGAIEYVFTFPQPATGTVQVAWAPGHGIVDQALTPNAFAGGNWTYRLDPNAADAPPYISEFMASNTRILADETGSYEDWIEIYNPSALTVNLDGWYLTDDEDDLTKWRFPATNLAGGRFLVVFASGENRRIPGARLHTSFSLSAGGEYLALVHPDGVTIASEFSPEYAQQIPDVSYGLVQTPAGDTLVAGTNNVYFTAPTPGAANLGGTAVPGPVIQSVQHSPNVPLDYQDLLVTARVTPSLRPVASVTMRYRVMFNSEVTLTMFDDGAHGDGAAGDSVYGATIPASASTNGQMIRYLIAATDVNAAASRWPLFASATATEEYLGTIVNPTNLTSKLPIFHLFVAPGQLGGIDSEGGGRLSFFYDGEFYDNIYMELRGNTSAGLAKKAHRLEFNRGHELRHAGPGGRTRKSSLLGEYLDPAYLRQHLCFWFLNQIGVPAPYDYPVRVQMNGDFYQLAFHNDVIGQEQVERMGYDPEGALYKAVGNLVPSFASTGVFQKLEPDDDPSRTDYLQLANGINEASTATVRRNTVFDLLDVPQVINHLSGARWCSENDDVWANMSIYRDTFGDGMWRCIPFDMNASWGQLYGGSNPLEATVDGSKSHPLYGGASTGGNYNRLYDVIVTLPETRQMLLRRERSIMDQMVQPPNTPTNQLILENYIRHMTNLIAVEANMDRAKWGFSPWASGKTFAQGVSDLLFQFIGPRRQHWYVTHCITNTSRAIGIGNNNNAGIPLSQPANALISVVGVEFNPSSANQDQEFITISNPSPYAVDITGWKLSGGVDFTFSPGTVLPSNSVAYVSPDTRAFRARTTGPRGGQGLFVLGPYSGQLSARGETLAITDPVGRIVYSNAFVGAPSAAQQYLRITEIMYRPAPAPAGSPYGTEDFEYIELKNISSNAAVTLVGVRFTNGIDFVFTAGSAVTSLAAGQAVVLVKNPAAFAARYGGGATVAGVYSGLLDNAGERLRLLDAANEEVLDFSYNNSWYPVTDGLGFSLVIRNENAPFNTWDEKESWRASGTMNGSPGQTDPAPAAVVPVLVNEVLANSEAGLDAIELRNTNATPADISDWWISDDFFTPRKYRVPAGTTIPAGGYIVFTEAQYNAGGTNFSFSAGGDEAFVFSGNAAGELTGFYHGFDFDASAPDVSFGRYLTSDGDEHFVAQSTNTLGSANALPRVGPIVISEIMYHPPDLVTGDDNQNEFIELHNISAGSVSMFDTAFPTNRWRLDDAVEFSFSTNTTIAAGGFLVVVGFDPVTNAPALATFRAKYGISTNVAIVGPWNGELNNSEDDVELKKPDTSAPTNITSVLVDKVHYHDVTPWEGAADGFGPSLIRIVEPDFGNDGTNWLAGAPTPGAASVIAPPPVITSHPAHVSVVVGDTASFTVAAAGTGLTFQWFFNGNSIPGANKATLQVTNVQLSQAGTYNVVALSGGGAALSSNAILSVLAPVTIVAQPQSQNVLPGTNVTLSVAAAGNGLLRYQWRFEGTNILNATNASYSFTGANLNEHHGNFSVVVMDSVSTVVSSNAFIFVMVRPGFVLQPAHVTVARGGTAVFTCLATGAPPIYYRWIRNGLGIQTSTVPVLVLTNVQIPSPNPVPIRCAITNMATGVGGINGNNVNLLVQVDADGDGVGDPWEQQYGFSTNNLADATLDSDGDGASNRDEYFADTNPTDPLSVLKLSATAGNATLQFVAQTNLSYSLQYRTNLSVAAWTSLSNIAGQASNIRTVQVNVPHPPPNPERFYRVATPAIP